MERELTQERLKELLDYDPLKGIFTWKVSPSNNVKVGDIAGKGKGTGYSRVSIDNRSYLTHRLVWLYYFGYMPEEVDHINHDRYDNRFCNLRAVSHLENCRNESKKINNTSGYTGVTWHKRAKKWLAQIMVQGKNRYLGLYKDKEEALRQRKLAELEYGFFKNHGI